MERSADTSPPGHLYLGEVMHHRLRPRRHRFVHRVAYLLLDIDRLGELDRNLRLFSHDRPNLVSFHDRDHGRRDGSPLRPWVQATLADNGLDVAIGHVQLLCMPRWLGHVFNPLSIYYCHDPTGRLAAIIYEVKNTFGEQHAYALPVDGEAARSTGSTVCLGRSTRHRAPRQRRGEDTTFRQSCAKTFHVSPFMEMAAHYHFRLQPPGAQRLSVVIEEDIGADMTLVASLTGKRRPLTDGELLRAYLRHPTHKVLAGIHFEALRLWLKGVPLAPRPAS